MNRRLSSVVSGCSRALRPAAFALAAWILCRRPAAAQEHRDLTELSLEELMNIEVTLASRTAIRLSGVAAAMTVISSDDIRRSGVTCAPEALRFVPGMEVARLDANKWAVSSRGFNSIYSNKLLVLQDGRSLYSPLFSGVFWESQDLVLEDVERIEVIRGPGATLWGSNAVNGIVNIITKSAKATTGGLVSAGGGTEEKAFGTARFGARLHDRAYGRLYVKHNRRDPFLTDNGDTAADGWRMTTAGFRTDWEPSGQDAVTLQGDLRSGEVGQEGRPTLFQSVKLGIPDYRTTLSNANVIGRWTHAFSQYSDVAVRASFDRTERRDTVVTGGMYSTFDLDLQYHLRRWTRHNLVLGAGYRVIRDRMDEHLMATMVPPRKTTDVWSAFVQDEISVAGVQGSLTIGSKFEHNDFTGFEIQPNLRFLWNESDRTVLWGSVSRAVRVPDRADFDLALDYRFDLFTLSLIGNPALRSEELLSWEFGWQSRPADWLWMSIAAFYNWYDRIKIFNVGQIRLILDPPSISLPFFSDNGMSGHTVGGEWSLDIRPSDRFRVRGSYAFLRVQLTPDEKLLKKYEALRQSAGLDESVVDAWLTSKQGKSPHHQASLRTSWTIRKGVEADLGIRFVDALPAIGIGRYVGLDSRIAWKWTFWPPVEWFIVGQNLIDRTHREFDEQPSPFGSTRIQRGVYAGFRLEF